jgi:ATP-dependent Clp protease ATP-binding subunit ClpB
VSRMIGAPPGYIGYDEGGQLTEAVRRRPYSVVLFDEIEKAHPDVFNVLLQILDDGRLTDSQGRMVDFRNTVLIMTSNIGSQLIVESQTDGQGDGRSGGQADGRTAGRDWSAVEERVRGELRNHFRPEFLNRVDDVVVFRPLSREDIDKIVDLQMARLDILLAEKGLTLKLMPAARELIAERGYDPVYGARPLKRVIQRLVQNPIALAVLEGGYLPGDAVLADRDGDHLVFTRQAAAAAKSA